MKLFRLVMLLCASLCLAYSASAASVLQQYLPAAKVSDLVPYADGFGPIRADLAAAPVLKGGETVGWVFATSDFVGTTGYSGKPIHTLVAVGLDAKIIGVKLVKHSEPIVLIGIPEAKVKGLVSAYAGLDLVAEAKSGGTAHDVDIISGATVTVMVIDDSIVRSGLKVARALGLGGLAPESEQSGPRFTVDLGATSPSDWIEAEGDGTIRRLSLDVAQVNAAFAEHADARARERALTEPPETTFIDMHVALVSVPSIGKALLGQAEQANLGTWLKEGENAIAITGRGLYSFKGSGYVRGGIFDRIVLIQDDVSVRFRDRDHRRLGGIALSGTPEFTEMDVFRIPANVGFDPTKPFRIQLLAHREVGPIEKVFHTFDLGYQLPQKYLKAVAQPAVEVASVAVVTRALPKRTCGSASGATKRWRSPFSAPCCSC